MNKFNDRTCETKVMKNGLQAAIIAYRYNGDIDVQFENGIVVQHRAYAKFRKCNIKCPMIFEYIDDYVKVANPNLSPPLTFLIDAEDVGLLGDGFWSRLKSGYVHASVDGKTQYLHRLIMNAPAGMDVDHINGDRSDCRRSNLRVCTRTGNAQNSKKPITNTSGYKGVSWDKQMKKWRVQLKANGEIRFRRLFSDKRTAAEAYDNAALKYHGEFARLNDLKER